MSNLTAGYKFALQHTDLCLRMADNNVNFVKEVLSEHAILAYVASLLSHMDSQGKIGKIL